ncbi:biliverdin-producing heme oxygenase [Luteibacter sp. CQ10]|uniref:biliverdin-producing heme oxygenase n=1 Tax=Luteibacter sp. CQ10 TaxID=2805821 RepID=UPI0034A5CC28
MDGAAASTPAHRILRERTRDAHEAVEAAEGMRRLMDGRMDQAGYEVLLAAQLKLFREWEAERGKWLAGISPHWLYLSRIAALETDTRFCGGQVATRSGIADESAPTEQGPAPYRTPLGRSRFSGDSQDATNWGELYVIEGSTLGARLIVKHLRERFPAHPHRYYAMGETTPARWRRFQSLLDAELTDDDARHHAVEGAHHMFARFRQALQDPAAHV